MSTPVPVHPPRSLAAAAAENGVSLGAYLILLALLSGLGSWAGIATLLVWAGSVGLPFFFYTLLRRNYAEASFTSGLAELWAQSLMSFVLASMLQAAVVYCVLRFMVPDFISSQIETAIANLESTGTPEGEIWASSFRRIIDETGVPTPVDVVANLIVFNVLCGAIIGLADSIVLRVRYASAERRARYTESHRRNTNN